MKFTIKYGDKFEEIGTPYDMYTEVIRFGIPSNVARELVDTLFQWRNNPRFTGRINTTHDGKLVEISLIKDKTNGDTN